MTYAPGEPHLLRSLISGDDPVRSRNTDESQESPRSRLRRVQVGDSWSHTAGRDALAAAMGPAAFVNGLDTDHSN
jgi:hypothetical protein